MSLETHEEGLFLGIYREPRYPTPSDRPEGTDWRAVLNRLCFRLCCFIFSWLIAVFWTAQRIHESQGSYYFALMLSPPFSAAFLIVASQLDKHLSRTYAYVCALRLSKTLDRLIVWKAGPDECLTSARKLSLADVRSFRLLSKYMVDKDMRGVVRSRRNVFGIEVVSLRKPHVLAFIDNESLCVNAADCLNARLAEWRQEQMDLEVPVAVASVDFPHSPASVIVTHATVLVETAPKSRLHFSYDADESFLCVRRRRRFPRRWIEFLLLALVEWFLRFLIFGAYQESSFRSMLSNPFVITGTMLWILPLVLTLCLWRQGDRWVIEGDRAKQQNQFGVPLSSCKISDIDRIELFAAQVPSIDTIRQATQTNADLVGGNRFGVRLMSSSNSALWSIDKIFEGEALFVSNELRRLCPMLCS